MTTIADVYDTYRSLILSYISPATGRGYEVAWRRRVLPSLGELDIESLSTLRVELAFASWSGSRSTKIDALSMLSRICKVAVKAGLIRSNPCIGAELPRTHGADPTSRALSLEEVARLLVVLPPSGPYRRFVLTLLYTGCRFGEVAGLRESDVDWETKTIAVRRTNSPGFNGELVIGPTKGRRVRAVPLSDPLMPIVLEAAEGKGPHDLLFPGPRGGSLSSKNLSRALDWFSVREWVKTFPEGEERLHWHDLRHTAAVTLFKANMSAPDVQAILGHSSLAVTQLYADTRNDAAQRGAAALSRFYGSQSMGQLRGGEGTAKSGSDQEI
ncbi:MAG: site-specific integrase [Microbacteriaceae bacterium]|nr:site-specific integrase [Microbacteriaceae bacterium]